MMSKTNNTFLKSFGLFCLVSIGMVSFSQEALAQGEQEKVEENVPRILDRPTSVDDHTSSQDISTLLAPEGTRVKPIVKSTTPAKKDSPEKDTKKTDSPSTLSFNLFLYVVDKFKENNQRAD
ncbi:hypothetical protein [Algoriphagus taiwanensis]|uniref:Uncharacterized protein n=1 Tax=Algoriphagus taiwanensis TaxID=1445656 RepID=A0ABQ6Q3J7_9BACT|nr:hypothetical protein Ataiwa_23300 [Algoriphagus taiwanensis]